MDLVDGVVLLRVESQICQLGREQAGAVSRAHLAVAATCGAAKKPRNLFEMHEMMHRAQKNLASFVFQRVPREFGKGRFFFFFFI
jgi:hypothetical protein